MLPESLASKVEVGRWWRLELLWIAVLGIFLLLLAATFTPIFGPLPFWLALAALVCITIRLAGLPRRWAIIATFVVTPFLLWAIPQVSVWNAKRQIERYQLGKVEPAAPITPKGDVLLATRLPVLRQAPGYSSNPEVPGAPYVCERLCMQLLFDPKVESVTVTDTSDLSHADIASGHQPLGQSARTYRLKEFGDCKAEIAQPQLGRFGRIDANDRVAAEWAIRSVNDICLAAEKPLTRFDLRIRQGLWGRPVAPTYWFRRRFGFHDGLRRPPPRPPEEKIATRWFDIRDADNRLLERRFDLWARALAAPLSVAGSNLSWFSMSGGRPSIWFVWQDVPRGVRRSRQIEIDKPQSGNLAIHGGLGRTELLTRVRKALQAAVADASPPSDSPVFHTVPFYLDLLPAANGSEADLDLVRRLILDPRLVDLPGAEKLIGSFDNAQHQRLRPAIARKLRMLSESDTEGGADLIMLVQRWPKDEMGKLLKDERQLLPRARRFVAVAYLKQIDETDADAAQSVADLIERNFRAMMDLRASLPADPRSARLRQDERKRSKELIDRSQIVSGAVTALCKVGPDAADQLPRLMKLEADERFPTSELPGSFFKPTHWDTMMVRLGKPAEAFNRVPDRYQTPKQYWAALRDLARPQHSNWCERR